MKKLIKSYKFWTTLAGAVGMFLTAISDSINIPINAQGAKEVVMAICGVLVAIGVVKIPHKKQGPNENSNNLNGEDLQQENCINLKSTELKPQIKPKEEKEQIQNIQK